MKMRNPKSEIRNPKQIRNCKLQIANCKFPPLTPHPSPLTPRHGVTLLEVLVSILIMTIGVLSVAALLPMGAYQAAQGRISDRASALGQEALRDFRIHGLSQADKWMTAGGASVVTNGTFSVKLPVCLDPWMVSRNGGPVTFGPVSRLTYNGLQAVAAADQVFISNDDLTFDRPTDADYRPTQVTIPAGTSPVKRQSTGDFSWLAMVAPADGDDGTIFPNKMAILSVVVFNHRNKDAALEVTKPATIPNGGGLGGIQLTFNQPWGPKEWTPPAAATPDVRAGSWVLVYGIRKGMTQNTCKWYRVAGVGLDSTTNPPQISSATLIGPDWDTSGASGQASVNVVLFDGAVGVYEKPIRLEGPSLWSN